MNGLYNIFIATTILLPSISQAEMPIFMMKDQNARMAAALPAKESSKPAKDNSKWSKTDMAIAAATAVGVYQYGERSGYKKVMEEIEVVKGQNKFTHAQIEGILRKLGYHGISLDKIINKQADHSNDLNKIIKAVERIEPKVDSAHTKLDAVYNKATDIERQATITNGKIDKMQGTINAHHAGQARQNQATHNMLRGIARILGVMHDESRSDSRQILAAIGEHMAKSKLVKALLRR